MIEQMVTAGYIFHVWIPSLLCLSCFHSMMLSQHQPEISYTTNAQDLSGYKIITDLGKDWDRLVSKAASVPTALDKKHTFC